MRWSVIALGMVGCGWGADKPTPRRAEARSERAERPERDAERPEREGERHERGLHVRNEPPEAVGGTVDAPPVVVLVIMDTVRADHTSLCGYERPTTPFLSSIIGGEATGAASFTCRAYTPGTWTLPSHASFFTGLYSTEHHVLNKGLPLDAGAVTLAEIFAANGYQTAMVAANPTLARASGLWQGFQVVNVAEGVTEDFRAARFEGRLARTLRDLDPAKPLFLVVNLFDAHDPYPAVPRGVSWLPARQGLKINPDREPPDGPVHRYVRGQMPQDEAKGFLQHVTDTYDYGIFLADRNVERTAAFLKEQGWLDRGYRLVVTSDHGEHLGEHQLLRHDGPPWETVSRVHLIYKDSTRTEPLPLPEPFAGTMVFSLLKDGRLPEPLLPAGSASIAYGLDLAPEHARKDAVALWPDLTRKLMWQGEGVEAYDLVADPGELSPTPAPAGPEVDAIGAAREQLATSKAVALGKGEDPEMVKALQAIGYIN